MRGERVKHSIAKKVTRRVFLLLLIAAAALFLGAFHTVYRIVTNENQRYAKAILGIYGDLLVDESIQKQIPVDAEHTENIIRFGEYLCEWYSVDYAYVYIPDVEAGKLTYLAASFHDARVPNAPEDNMAGRTVECSFTPEELAVWRGEALFGQVVTDNEFGHEISTVMRITDAYDNHAIAGIDIAFANVRNEIIRNFVFLALVIAAVAAGVYYAVYRIVRKKVSEPAQMLSRTMQEYIKGGKRSEARLPVAGEDEFSMMAGAFNQMTDDIGSYLESISVLSREQANRQTELEIAARIQRGFLSKPLLEREDCRLRGRMTPARDVGGDLYDYLPLDEHRVLLVVADVSGKGISAAILMAMTLTLFRQYAKMGLPPDEILRRTNDSFSEKNTELLFVTAFVGIYDSDTMRLTYANAGHNLPYIVGKELRKLDGARGLLLGLYPGEDYTCASTALAPGETLLLYTDGVTEAVNTARQFFGEARLEAALRDFRSNGADDPVRFISDAVAAFSEGAEQHDDITLLALTAKRSVSMELDFDIREFSKIKAQILALPIPRSRQLNICLAAEERFANLCSYAFRDGAPAGEKIGFSMTAEDRIELRFTDGGTQYDPLKNVISAEDYDIDTQIGGLGKLIGISLSDRVEYEYRDGKNILTMIFDDQEEQA